MAKFKDVKIGPTGKFPFGKIDAHDDGELQLAIVADRDHGLVCLIFGTAVTELRCHAKEARAIAAALLEKADELDQGTSA